ncbi:hypothetical protein [Actinomadura rubrisoli]|uniref:Uncharacterized protein n=1 Tax=Actinomadura rubrisoli TaxID=2530368 RepID=A0A4R5CA90_9ACTN|nr:hypothetical protein [Actinomadura rubrisoli]TDD95113.1 hypothetical protein E1298_05560 [Actinomadura rubrisoli]
MELARRSLRWRRRSGTRLRRLLVVAVFLAYGSPCVPLGHCHGDHAVSSAAESLRSAPISQVKAPSPEMATSAEPCHEAPPEAAIPDSQVTGLPVYVPLSTADALVVPAATSLAGGPLQLPGEALYGLGLAGYRTGAAALAVLCIFRT